MRRLPSPCDLLGSFCVNGPCQQHQQQAAPAAAVVVAAAISYTSLRTDVPPRPKERNSPRIIYTPKTLCASRDYFWGESQLLPSSSCGCYSPLVGNSGKVAAHAHLLAPFCSLISTSPPSCVHVLTGGTSARIFFSFLPPPLACAAFVYRPTTRSFGVSGDGAL